MTDWISNLIGHASEALLPHSEMDISGTLEAAGVTESQRSDYLALLDAMNGFYAYGRELLVRPLGDADSPRDLIKWNAHTTWEHLYNMPMPEIFCFAGSVFGEQFCFCEGWMVRFDPESGEVEQIARSMNEWAKRINADPDMHTGRLFLELWESQNGPLPAGHVLIPKRPFMLGGSFAVDNLVAVDELEAMRIRAPLANEVYDTPDGTAIRIEVYRTPDERS